jgi:hypothetical protein
MDLSNSAARLTTSAVAIAPSHHRRLRVRNVNIQQGCHSRIDRSREVLEALKSSYPSRRREFPKRLKL